MAQADIVLYTNTKCPYAHRAHIALEELGIPYKQEFVDLDTPRTPEYLKVNPRGLIPSMSYDGEIITESAIVVQFVADTHPSDLLPASSDPGAALTRAKATFFADSWASKVQPHVYKLTYATSESQVEEAAKAAPAGIIKEIEPLLSNAAPFFNGSDKLTFAEAMVAPFVIRFFTLSKHGLVPVSFLETLEKEAPNFYKWAQAVNKHPSVLSNYDEDLIVEGAKKWKAKLQAQAQA